MSTDDTGPRRGAAFALAGALAFAAVQGVLFLVAGGPLRDSPGWFLNAGRNVAVVTGALAAVAAVMALVARRDAVQATLMVALGAVVAMVITLFVTGPGSIFPIVIVVGGFLITAAVFAGTLVGVLAARLRKR